ncbi:MAG TPA: hypothetical protein VMB34_27805 [Acetobacteraceae bacterium]|nr:hypothetical protein [Acetobacteraceae bacterium]
MLPSCLAVICESLADYSIWCRKWESAPTGRFHGIDELGHALVETPYCGIVSNPAHPDLWDANHADDVRDNSDEASDAMLAAMDTHLAHSDWRVVHTDAFTPEAFLARFAYEGFKGGRSSFR